MKKQALAVLMILVLALTLCSCSNGKDSSLPTIQQPVTINAQIDEQGQGFLFLEKGEVIDIGADVKQAVFTANREHIVILTDNGTLQVATADLKNKKDIADDVSAILYVRDNGFFFTTNDLGMSRFMFGNEELLKIDRASTVPVTLDRGNSLDILYGDGKDLFLLRESENKPEKVYSCSGQVWPVYQISDLDTSLWIEEEKQGEYAMKMSRGGDVETLYSFTLSTWSGLHQEYVGSKDGKVGILLDHDGRTTLVIGEDSDPVRISTGNSAPFMETMIYSQKGAVETSESSEIETMYIAVPEEAVASQGFMLYAFSKDGDSEKMLDNVKEYMIYDGQIIYLDTDGELHQGTLNGYEIENDSRIAKDVDGMSSKGAYLYYVSNVDYGASTGDLYGMKVGDKEGVKISSDVSCRCYFESTAYLQTEYSHDGSAVFFYKDFDEETSAGALHAWDYKSQKRIKIDDDVIVNSLVNGGTGPVTNGVTYEVYDSTSKDNTVIVSRAYYDGKSPKVLKEDLIHQLYYSPFEP